MVSYLLSPSKYHQVGLLKPQAAKATIHHQQPRVHFPSEAHRQPHSGEPAAAQLPGRGIWERHPRGQLKFHPLMYFMALLSIHPTPLFVFVQPFKNTVWGLREGACYCSLKVASKAHSLEYFACSALVRGDAAPSTLAKHAEFSCVCRTCLSDRFVKWIC